MSYDITETYVGTVCFTKYIIEKSSKKDRTGCMEKITKNCDKPVFFSMVYYIMERIKYNSQYIKYMEE